MGRGGGGGEVYLEDLGGGGEGEIYLEDLF